MLLDKHESDLYILPESSLEKTLIIEFLNLKRFSFQTCYSDVKGGDWFGKTFFDVFCGYSLKDELVCFVNNIKNAIKED